MPVDALCGYCGQVTRKSPSVIKKARRGVVYCNMKCYRAWEATTKITVKCDACGKEFLRYAHHAQRNAIHFCDPKCRGAWNTLNNRGENHPRWVPELAVKCDQCGKEFRQGKTRQKRNKHNFCCVDCSRAWMIDHGAYVGENNHNWKGGTIDYYGPNWYRQAHKARLRDGDKCRHCKKPKKKVGRRLDVHHIIPFRTFGYIRNENDFYKQANHLSNLICLCQQCHAKAEAQLIPIQPSLLP